MAQDFWQTLDADQAAAKKAPAPHDTTDAPVQPPATAPEQDGPSTVGEAFADTGRAAFHAVDSAGRGLIDTAIQGVINPVFGTDIPEFPQPTMVAQPQYAINKIAKAITAYGIGFFTGGVAAKAAGAAKAALSTLKGAAGQSMVGVGLTASPHEDRLANLVQEYPFLENPLAEYLSSKPGDTFAEGKLKAILDDGLGSSMGLFAFKAITHGAKVSRGLLKPASKEALAAESELEQMATKANEAAEAGTIKAEKYPNQISAADELDALAAAGERGGASKPPGPKQPVDIGMEAQASAKLGELEDKAGGAKPLEKLAEKSFKGREAFTLSPEQYADFELKMLHNVGAGEMNELYVKGLPEGAFNYSKMENLADVHATLQSLAEVIAPQLQKTGKTETVMSFAEMQRTAALFGSKPDVMMANLRSWGVDAKSMPATFLAAKNWSQSLANEIFRDARSVAIMGSGGNSAKMEAMRKISVLADLEGMMKSVQTAGARITAAGRIRTSPRYTGEDMLKMLDEMGGASKVDKLMEKIAMTDGKPENINNLLRVSWQRKILDTHNELWINAILSGPSTHVVNIGTAGVNTFLKPGHIALGGLIRGDMESVRAGLGVYKGLGSVYKDSFSMARKAFALERPLLSHTDKQLEIESTISAGNYNLNPESWVGQGVNWLGKAARIPSRFLGSEDEFWKQMSYRAKLNQSATMEATKMVQAGQLDPKKMVDFLSDGKTTRISEVDAWIQNKFNEGFQYEMIPEFGAAPTPVKGLDKDAIQFANEGTFTQSLKIPTWLGNRSLAETAYQAANTHPMLRGTVLPFVKVPANLLREGASYMPGVAQLRKQFWSDMAAGGEKASEAIGKMATGTMLLSGATYLAVEGKITGGAPTDPDIRKRMYEKNWQPYSFVFENADGSKTYVPFARFDPWGLVFGIVGDVAQTFQHIDEDSRHSFAAASTMAVANLLNSRSYLKGMVDALDVLHGGQGQDGVDKLVRILNQRAASYIPNVVRTAQPDTEIKEIRSMMDALMAKTPGLAQNVPAKRGYFGDKLMAPIGWPWNAILPSKVGQESTDPALLELARLSDGPAQAHFKEPAKRVGTLDLTKFSNAEGVTAYDRMMEKLNETDFHEKMNDLVTSDEYKAGTDGDAFYPGSKQTDIKKLELKYHKKALKETLIEFQDNEAMIGFDLKGMVQTDKRNLKASKRGGDVTELDRLLELNR